MVLVRIDTICGKVGRSALWVRWIVNPPSLVRAGTFYTFLVASGGTPPSTAAGMPLPMPLQVTVKNGVGGTLSGVTVTFSAPPVGASAALFSPAAVTKCLGHRQPDRHRQQYRRHLHCNSQRGLVFGIVLPDQDGWPAVGNGNQPCWARPSRVLYKPR